MAIKWELHNYAELDSTQDFIKDLATQGLPEGFAVQALTQTKGHGRHGREWASPMGNLYLSFLLRPDCSVQEAGRLSFVTAVAVSAAIDGYLARGHDKKLKWPNDILIDGKKCAGILLESDISSSGRLESLAVGIGVNIMAAPEEAVCLKDVCGDARLAIHPFRDDVLARFADYYQIWQEEGFGPIREKWLAQAHAKGEEIEVRLSDKTISGIFKTIDESGALILETDGDELVINTGEIFFSA